MNDEERQAIIDAARRHAIESARAQGLPDTITDPDTIRKIATIIAAHRADKRAA